MSEDNAVQVGDVFAVYGRWDDGPSRLTVARVYKTGNFVFESGPTQYRGTRRSASPARYAFGRGVSGHLWTDEDTDKLMIAKRWAAWSEAIYKLRAVKNRDIPEAAIICLSMALEAIEPPQKDGETT